MRMPIIATAATIALAFTGSQAHAAVHSDCIAFTGAVDEGGFARETLPFENGDFVELTFCEGNLLTNDSQALIQSTVSGNIDGTDFSTDILTSFFFDGERDTLIIRSAPGRLEDFGREPIVIQGAEFEQILFNVAVDGAAITDLSAISFSLLYDLFQEGLENPRGATLSFNGTARFNLRVDEVELISPVPLPGAFAFLLTGLGAVAAARGRRG